VDGLSELGLEVDAVGAYRTITASPDETGEAVLAGRLDAVLVTSGSVARALVELAPALTPSTVIACIGERTAVEATEAGLRVDVVAPRQRIASLVESLSDYFAANPRTVSGAPESSRTSHDPQEPTA